MRRVVDAEHQIAARLARQTGGVGERGKVLAKSLRLVAVALELEPLRLGRQGAQAVDERDALALGHASASSGLRRRRPPSSSVAISASFVERLRLLDLLRQLRRRLAHVELAGDHVGDQAGAVFAEERDPADR